VVVLDSVITHTSAWFLDREIHQLVEDDREEFRKFWKTFWVKFGAKLTLA